MNRQKAAQAGLFGAAIMTLFVLSLRGLGLTRVNLELMLGSMIIRSFSTGSWFLGLLIHGGLGALFGLLYGRVLKRRGGWRIGLGLGCLHAILSGLFLPILSQVHPLVWDRVLTSPGLFAAGTDWQVMMLFGVLHLVYGTVVGAYCGIPVAETVPSARPARRRLVAVHEQ
jgi:hypothetical protein